MKVVVRNHCSFRVSSTQKSLGRVSVIFPQPHYNNSNTKDHRRKGTLKDLPNSHNLESLQTNQSKPFKRIVPKKLRIQVTPQMSHKSAERKSGTDTHKSPLSSTGMSIRLRNLVLEDDEEVCFKRKVRRALWLKEGTLVAIKHINKPISPAKATRIKSFQHPHLLQVLEVQSLESESYIYTRWIHTGSLDSILKSFGPLNQLLIKRITKQLVSAVHHLHLHTHIHGSITSSKIFLDQKGSIKLSISNCDESESKGTEYSDIRKIVWYSPERTLGNKASQACDVWGIGCVVLQMLTGKSPWCCQSTLPFSSTDQYLQVLQTRKTPIYPQSTPLQLKTFLQGCLQTDIENRKGVSGLLECEYLAGE